MGKMKHDGISVRKLINMCNRGEISLDPIFQRKGVWGPKARNLLIKTIMENLPAPSLIFYEDIKRGRRNSVLEVLDGKQRLETILYFTGDYEKRRYQGVIAEPKKDVFLPDEDNNFVKWFEDFTEEEKDAFYGYEFPYTQYNDKGEEQENNDVMEVFVRINKTGTKLNNGELLNANCFNKEIRDTPFMKMIRVYAGGDVNFRDEDEKASVRLKGKERAFIRFILNSKIMSKEQLDRFLALEFLLELFYFLHKGYVHQNKKAPVFKFLKEEVRKIEGSELNRLKREFNNSLAIIEKIQKTGIINFKLSIFNKRANFYSLFCLTAKLLGEGAHFDANSIKKTATNLKDFSASYKQGGNLKGVEKSIVDIYKKAVVQGSDSSDSRKIREGVLGMTFPEFRYKDKDRLFSDDIKELLRSTSKIKNGKIQCKLCKEWFKDEDLSVDHMIAWSKTGKTMLSNAQLLCKSCNSIKRDKSNSSVKRKRRELKTNKKITERKVKRKVKRK